MSSDVLKAMNNQEDKQTKMTDAEVITVAIVTAIKCGCNFEKARKDLAKPYYIPEMLSKSRLNRRIHALSYYIYVIFKVLGKNWEEVNKENAYVIDSYPVQVYDNIRISESKIYQGEDFRGYNASKRRYFYGLKIHLCVTKEGKPVEFFFTPGGENDTDSLKLYLFDLAEGSTIYGDKAYNDYSIEDMLKESADITLLPYRKSNSLCPLAPYIRYIQTHHRQIVETSFSLIERLLPKSIHAVTSKGFELKCALFVLAFSFNFFLSSQLGLF
jgi:hypothetical protein